MATVDTRSYVLVFLLVAVLSGSDAEDPAVPPKCPDGFSGHLNSCYKFMKMSVSWEAARVYCSTMRARLVRIPSQEVETYLIGEIRSQSADFDKEYVWIDVSDMEEEGVFKWMSANKVVTYSNWMVGQPDNMRHPSGDDEHCIALTGSDGMKWADYECIGPAHFICEISLIEDFQNGIIG